MEKTKEHLWKMLSQVAIPWKLSEASETNDILFFHFGFCFPAIFVVQRHFDRFVGEAFETNDILFFHFGLRSPIFFVFQCLFDRLVG